MKQTTFQSHDGFAATTANELPEFENPGLRLYRLKQVLSLIPVSRSSWFEGIQKGRYPKGFHLGPRTTVWRSDQIESVITRLGVAA
jgi:predicted DNA-binding transcriptional regulator AlpA